MCKRAFTLLEIMLVIFLLAVATTFIVPTIMRPHLSPAELAAGHFYRLLIQLRDRAHIHGQVTGVRIDHQHYRFMHYAQGKWQPAAVPRASASNEMPQGVQIVLQQGANFRQQASREQRLALHDMQLEMQQGVEGVAPQVWFSPHQPPAPFSVQFRQSPNTCQEVAMRGNGEIVLQSCPEDNG